MRWSVKFFAGCSLIVFGEAILMFLLFWIFFYFLGMLEITFPIIISIVYIIQNMINGTVGSTEFFPVIINMTSDIIIELVIRPAYCMAALFLLGFMLFFSGLGLITNTSISVVDEMEKFFSRTKK